MTTAELERTGPEVLDKTGTQGAPWVPPHLIDRILLVLGIILYGEQINCVRLPFRFKVFGAGIRRGKSFTAALMVFLDLMWMMYRVTAGIETRSYLGTRWAMVGPDYRQCRAEILFLIGMCHTFGLRIKPSTPLAGSWTIQFTDFPGFLVETISSKDVTVLASYPYRGMVIAEAGKHPEGVYQAARERVNEDFGWVFLCGTFEEAKGPWYSQLARDWESPDSEGQSFFSASWENPVTYPEGENSPKIVAEKKIWPPEVFAERYGGRPQRPSRLVMKYADPAYQVRRRYELEGTSYDPSSPVYLGIDPGWTAACAILAVQRTGNDFWVIDIIYRWNRSIEQLVGGCVIRPWAANVTDAIVDVAGDSPAVEGDPFTKQWRREWKRRTGNRIQTHTNRVGVMDGYILHNRALLNTWPLDAANEKWNALGDEPQDEVIQQNGPKLFYDPGCRAAAFGGIVDGQRYAGEYNLHKRRQNQDGTVTSNKPIDADNHLIKTVNYLLFYFLGVSGQKKRGRKRRERGYTDTPHRGTAVASYGVS